jgi:hypothetical protein
MDEENLGQLLARFFCQTDGALEKVNARELVEAGQCDRTVVLETLVEGPSQLVLGRLTSCQCHEEVPSSQLWDTCVHCYRIPGICWIYFRHLLCRSSDKVCYTRSFNVIGLVHVGCPAAVDGSPSSPCCESSG